MKQNPYPATIYNETLKFHVPNPSYIAWAEGHKACDADQSAKLKAAREVDTAILKELQALVDEWIKDNSPSMIEIVERRIHELEAKEGKE